jgi:putative addiction module component (TIGR02574 family)
VAWGYDDGVSAVVHRLLDEALTLSESDRRMLAEALFDSVTIDELEPVWRAEILRRIEQVQRGEVTAVPWSEVRRRMREARQR